MYMRLVDPTGVRQEFARQHKWYTLKEIAAGCNIAETAARRALRGARVWVQTIEAIAEKLGREPLDIAEIVE
jgi:transcriptional regulator with XRE-family HTH domain